MWTSRPPGTDSLSLQRDPSRRGRYCIIVSAAACGISVAVLSFDEKVHGFCFVCFFGGCWFRFQLRCGSDLVRKKIHKLSLVELSKSTLLVGRFLFTCQQFSFFSFVEKCLPDVPIHLATIPPIIIITITASMLLLPRNAAFQMMEYQAMR